MAGKKRSQLFSKTKVGHSPILKRTTILWDIWKVAFQSFPLQ